MGLWARFDANYNVRSDGQIHQSAINLDAMGDDDLALAEIHPALHADVRTYATLKRSAMWRRKSGDIQGALALEKRCERVYDKDIPLGMRW